MDSSASRAVKESLKHASRWSVAQWWSMVKAALSSWVDDYAPSMGAALSYYTVFSLAPLLVIVISLAGLIFGAEAVRGEIFSQIDGLMGAEAAKAIQDLLGAVSKPSTGIIGTVIGTLVLLIGATTVFGELQDALDRIWRAPAREESSGLWSLVRTRLLSFGMILGIAFLLMVSLVVGAATSALGKWWGGWFDGWEILLQILNAVVGFVMTTAVFALIYKMMPRVKVGWGDVWVGAAVTALLFTVGRFLIGLYIGKTGVASGFGAAGSVAVVFVWVYYSAQIFLVGAEFTWVYAQRMGSRRNDPEPTDEMPTRSLPAPRRGSTTTNAASPPLETEPAAAVGDAREPVAADAAASTVLVSGMRLPSSIVNTALVSAAAVAALALISRRLRRDRPSRRAP
ncbi:MAG: YihY/virulence factor BrkB family protein [Rubrivivax sp.]